MSTTSVALPAVGIVMPLGSQRGGAESLLQNLLHTQSRCFRYAFLFLQDGPLAAEARSLGHQTTVLTTTHLSDLANYARSVRAVRKWIRHSRLDLVFSWMQKAHLYAGPAAVSARTKRMWFQHGLSKGHWMDVLGACLPADGILCCSQHVKLTQDQRFPSHPTFACHPGVPMRGQITSSKADARAQLRLRANGPVICMVARLERWKGAHIFVEAASLLAAQFPDAQFCIIGGSHPMDEAYAGEVERLAQTRGLSDCLLLVGQRPSQEIPYWHAAADVIVHPVTEPEPFGMAIVEALTAGRAVVASRAGGISEIIVDGVSGVLVPPNDARAVAAAVSSLLLDVNGRERMEVAAAARAHVFSIEAFAGRFETIISSVLAA